MAESPGLRVLITNRVLARRTGTELYVRDLALGLLRRGHLPIVYSPLLGPLADEIRAATVPVVDDLARVGAAPDVIHGHHGVETLSALLAFPGVPAISFCHSWIGWADAPVVFPRVLRHVAVDHTCRDRLLHEHGIPADRVHVALNAVDLERFRPRGPLPSRPARALVFSNGAGGKGSHLEAVRSACASAGSRSTWRARGPATRWTGRRRCSGDTTWCSPRRGRRWRRWRWARPWCSATSPARGRWSPRRTWTGCGRSTSGCARCGTR